jgi:hypothetical protein
MCRCPPRLRCARTSSFHQGCKQIPLLHHLDRERLPSRPPSRPPLQVLLRQQGAERREFSFGLEESSCHCIRRASILSWKSGSGNGFCSSSSPLVCPTVAAGTLRRTSRGFSGRATADRDLLCHDDASGRGSCRRACSRHSARNKSLTIMMTSKADCQFLATGLLSVRVLAGFDSRPGPE